MIEEKDKKNLYLPVSLIKKLNAEGELLNGKPGLVVTAALELFFQLDGESKANLIQWVQQNELCRAYEINRPTGKSEGIRLPVLDTTGSRPRLTRSTRKRGKKA